MSIDIIHALSTFLCIQVPDEVVENIALVEMGNIMKRNGNNLNGFLDMSYLVADISLGNQKNLIQNQLEYDQTSLETKHKVLMA